MAKNWVSCHPLVHLFREIGTLEEGSVGNHLSKLLGISHLTLIVLLL